MKLIINGENKKLPFVQPQLQDLFEFLKLNPDHIMIELNAKWLQKPYTNITLRENDHLEIVHFVGGGNRSRLNDYAGS